MSNQSSKIMNCPYQKRIMPKEQQKIGAATNGKDNMIAFLAESLGVECKNGILEFGKNEEFMKIYTDLSSKQ